VFLPKFTVSREDLYDYLRCPKIVAIKTHRTILGLEREKEVGQRAQPEVPAAVVGKIGEAAVAVAFDWGFGPAGTLRGRLCRRGSP
jgi:hypothetical protein